MRKLYGFHFSSYYFPEIAIFSHGTTNYINHNKNCILGIFSLLPLPQFDGRNTNFPIYCISLFLIYFFTIYLLLNHSRGKGGEKIPRLNLNMCLIMALLLYIHDLCHAFKNGSVLHLCGCVCVVSDVCVHFHFCMRLCSLKTVTFSCFYLSHRRIFAKFK